MKNLFWMLAVLVLLLGMGCANHIRYADAVIWDRVPDTDRVSLDEQRIENGLIQAKVRFVCQKRQYSIINELLTPYDPGAELYEVPVGLVTFPFTLLWYGICEAISLASAPVESAAGPFHWSVSGLNPFLNVENGMFVERYSVVEKEGSRRPQEGSSPEPYDAVLPPDGGMIKARFDGGGMVDILVGDEVLLTVNLVELARVMPAEDTQKIEIQVRLRWNPETEPVLKTVTVFIDQPLASKLFALKQWSHILMTTDYIEEFDRAIDVVNKSGFSREAAMIRDKRRASLVRLPPQPQKKADK
ncbi:MAG: hypothetical protein ABIK28_06500 [Planctomycetota bacterium]